MPTLEPWPELQPLAARIAVGELDGEEAIAAIVDAIVRRELEQGGGRSTPSLRAAAATAVAADRVLMAMLRPAAPMRELFDEPPPGAPAGKQAAVRLAPEPPRRRVREEELDELDELDGEDEAPPRARRGAQRPVEPDDGGRRRIHPGIGVAIGAVAGGALWWFVIRATPCETFAHKVCLELAEPCSAVEVESHLAAKQVTGATCDAALVAADEAAAKVGSNRRARAYLDALVEAIGFDPRTGVAPTAAPVAERAPVEPVMLARKLPSLPSLEVDEAYLWVSSGEAVLRLRAIGGAFEPIATAPGARALAVTADFVYWVARGADGTEAIFIDRKRGEYEPTVLATTPAKLGAVRCTLGACAYVDLTDGGVWIAAQDGTAPRRLAAAQNPAPTEVWIDDREVAWGLPGTGVVAVPVAGGTPRVVAGAEVEVRSLHGDGDGWLWTAAGALRQVARAGGDVATLVPSGVGDFAIDKAHAYVGDPTSGAISRVPRAGGAPAAIVSGQVGVEHVVVDAAALYWTRGGELFRVPKG